MPLLNEFDLKFCVRRLPKKVRDMLINHKDRLFVAGGFIRSVICNEPISDIDIFSPTKEYAEACAKALADGGRIYETDYAYTLTDVKPTVQFIHRWTFETIADCVASFDFTIASAGFWFRDANVGIDPGWSSLCHNSFYQDLAAKRLIYLSPVRNEDAGGSMLRVLKFYQRGYRIPLDSLAAVIARLHSGVKVEKLDGSEQGYAKIITGLLREVDPNTPMEGFPHD